jgi:predicted nucleotidyltransferase component of viral defense system
MIKEWIEEYKPASRDEADQALREIMQQVALAGLQRSGFFEKAAFYGGTSLRIFYGLERFSEDLDFTLLEVNPDFSLQPFLDGMKQEFEALGIQVSVKEKTKTQKTAIDSAFLKPGTQWKEIILKDIIRQEKIGSRPEIKIKLEVDTTPPPGFATEEKLLLRPFSFYTKCYVASDLFAGKLHALLFRKWGSRVKGRDWFDFEWYVKKQIPLNLAHFTMRAIQSGDWKKDSISPDECKELLNAKIDAVSFKSIKEDIVKYIRDDKVLDIWSPEYFRELVKRIIFKG